MQATNDMIMVVFNVRSEKATFKYDYVVILKVMISGNGRR